MGDHLVQGYRGLVVQNLHVPEVDDDLELCPTMSHPCSSRRWWLRRAMAAPQGSGAMDEVGLLLQPFPALLLPGGQG